MTEAFQIDMIIKFSEKKEEESNGSQQINNNRTRNGEEEKKKSNKNISNSNIMSPNPEHFHYLLFETFND